MKIQRTLPPAAAPIYLRDFLNGLKGIIRGKREIKRFEEELKAYFGVKYCFLLCSGRAALTTILQSLKAIYPEKDEVLIPAYTCFSVPSAIHRAGLKIKLCDVDADTLDFNYDQLTDILSPPSTPEHTDSSLKLISRNKILAIIPTHLFGIPTDVHKVKRMVNNYDTFIIEDAAQAMGGVYKEKKLGTIGDIGFFSLGRGKAFSTIEGGIIITSRDDIADKIRIQIESLNKCSIIETIQLIAKTISLMFFLNPLLFWVPKSLPFLKLGETEFNPDFKTNKLSSFQSGLANNWLKKLNDFKTTRIQNTEYWQNMVIEKFANDNRLSAVKPKHDFGLIRFPIRVYDQLFRERILEKSQQTGLGIMPTYPDSVHIIAKIKEGKTNQDFPIARKLVNEIITLPTHSLVKQKDKQKTALLITKMKSESNQEYG